MCKKTNYWVTKTMHTHAQIIFKSLSILKSLENGLCHLPNRLKICSNQLGKQISLSNWLELALNGLRR